MIHASSVPMLKVLKTFGGEKGIENLAKVNGLSYNEQIRLCRKAMIPVQETPQGKIYNTKFLDTGIRI